MERYRGRISGPLLDRIDLHVEVPSLTYEEITSAPVAEGTATVRVRVEEARRLQRERFKGSAIYCNAQMGAREVREHCRHDEGCAHLLEGEGRGDSICLPQVDGILRCTDSVRNIPLQESEVQAPFPNVITDGLK